MKVNLRIVGIFYSTIVTIHGNKKTVKDVLEAAIKDPGKNCIFQYTTHISNNRESICSFSVKFTSDFKSHTGERPYPAGIYSISEDLISSPIYSVWQYSIFNKKNVYKNRDNGAVPFNKADISDGDSVVWRLLNIHAPANQKNCPVSPRLEGLFSG